VVVAADVGLEEARPRRTRTYALSTSTRNTPTIRANVSLRASFMGVRQRVYPRRSDRASAESPAA
jgi:hypothetical protein